MKEKEGGIPVFLLHLPHTHPTPFAQFSSIQPGFLSLAMREVADALGISILHWVLG